jgi:hypothetical protein
MQVTGDKAAVILGVGDRVSSAKAGAGTIGIIKVGAKVGIAVSVKAGIVTTGEIRRTGSIIRVFRGFKARAGCVVTAGANTRDRKGV